MSRFSGPQGRGALRTYREAARVEASRVVQPTAIAANRVHVRRLPFHGCGRRETQNRWTAGLSALPGAGAPPVVVEVGDVLAVAA